MAESYASQFARKGGLARAKKLSKKQLKDQASVAAKVRWAKVKKSPVKEG